MRPIKQWPGYFITQDGRVYSSRYSRDGSLKERTVRKDGSIVLIRPGSKMAVKIAKLMQDTWGDQS